ncbi:hypothetical protein SISSUDRAFT_615374 [Sistotremastrum suecicum HHB10207 ss-3]|uniref:Uncharacterized protein n=1 Tax=Sistotremastrum suecicum HHB10207 ss-3 TaxID=1314776 RepID=A0A166IE07_9AGAM|nr:hypothetical protein SISSUDRAFT_615374 [Sistotremastrum suecicum HHB10207 ss-3]
MEPVLEPLDFGSDDGADVFSLMSCSDGVAAPVEPDRDAVVFEVFESDEDLPDHSDTLVGSELLSELDGDESCDSEDETSVDPKNVAITRIEALVLNFLEQLVSAVSALNDNSVSKPEVVLELRNHVDPELSDETISRRTFKFPTRSYNKVAALPLGKSQ